MAAFEPVRGVLAPPTHRPATTAAADLALAAAEVGPGAAREGPGRARVEPVSSGKGVPGGRADRLDRLPAAERAAIVAKALAPASVAGTIDREAFPEMGDITLHGVQRDHWAAPPRTA